MQLSKMSTTFYNQGFKVHRMMFVHTAQVQAKNFSIKTKLMCHPITHTHTHELDTAIREQDSKK